ncbi:SMC5-SMC6 complex localization factor protein 1-like [Actinia tenebrosa]|uniref:SMC5-SMC6 complex localization factor protein 1-like n=1 Tax=Actinia tenebrosa TaxID=6105 RepID=A0A6P8INV5_ACTTE|nr:SMC5-SMC6 complex localization factor protein 1-like [Actinia tenebrosa]
MAADLSRSQPEKRKRYHFLLSSFTQEEREELNNAIQTLGGIYTETPHFFSSSSHIVCKKPNRGEKFLCGCATGKWILNKDYIMDSAKAQRWLDEDAYEWNKDSNITGIPLDHVSAPMRWRKAYDVTQRGPFHGWRTLVVIKDAKRKIAYKRLLDAGQATVLNARPPFQANLVEKVTHVFAEKAMEKVVQCFLDAGIPCLSPDYIPEYILQDPIPSMDDFSILNYSNPKAIPKTVNREPTNRYITPVYPPGECGAPKTKSRISDIKMRNQGQKRQAEAILIEDHPSPPKKLKQIKNHEEIFPNWLEWHSTSPWVLNMDLTTCERPSNQAHLKSKKSVSTFPTYVVNAIDSYLEEEGHESIVLSTITSFLSSTRHPAPSLVYTIINRFLLKASTPQLASQAYMVLHHLVSLHPPPVRSYLYQQAMQSPISSSKGIVKAKSSAWEFLSDTFSLALEVKNGNYIKDASTSRQTRDNSLLLIKFLCGVLEKDFQAVKEKKEYSGGLYTHKESLIWNIIWPDGQGGSVNRAVRQLFKLLWISAKQSEEDNVKIQVLLALQGLVAMVAACFEYMDQSTLGTNTSGAKVGSRMVSLATELVLTCGRSHDQEGSLRMLLESCRPAWLKMKVLDIMLHSYDDCLVPQESKHLLAKGLCMEKIVCCYFFLLPVSSTTSPAMNVENTSPESDPITNKDASRHTALRLITDANTYHSISNDLHKEPAMKLKKLMVNKRNARGETPLHKAAIKNEPPKIRELIEAGADVNLTDHAGWTPLHEACNHGNEACVEEILKVRPLVYKTTRNEGMPGLYILASPCCGTTPLHDAVNNNHMNVAKLLLEAGGLPLLQATNKDGLTPLDVSVSEAMTTYLKTTERNLLNKTNQLHQTNKDGEQASILRVPSDKEYFKVLGKKGCKLAHISENCHVYLLLLSQLVQSYARLYNLGYIHRTGVNNDGISEKGLQEAMDGSIMCTFSSHVEKLKCHLNKVTSGYQLSTLCQSRLEAMKFI